MADREETYYLVEARDGRVAGTGTGEQAGRLAEGTGRAGAAADQRAAAAQRANLARNLRGQEVSTKDFGITSGTDAKRVLRVPPEMWDAEMQACAERIKAETGKDVTFILGSLEVEKNGRLSHLRGVWSGDGIIIQADNARVTIKRAGSARFPRREKKRFPNGPGCAILLFRKTRTGAYA